MEEKEYLLSKSVQDCSVGNDLNAKVDIDDEADDESGVFCNSSDFQKSDPTVSLSYWMGQLLTENLISGRDLLLKHLLREAEYEEQDRSFLPAEVSTPIVEKKKTIDKRKRKLDSGDLDSCTSSLLEVSRRLDSLLANSRKMNDDLKVVRSELNDVEASLARVSEDFEATQTLFKQTSASPQNVEECEFVTRILAAAFGPENSCRNQRSDIPQPSARQSDQRNVVEAPGAESLRNFFDSLFWNRSSSSGEKKLRNGFDDCVKFDDFDDDAVDFISCTNIPNVSCRFSEAKTSQSDSNAINSRPDSQTFHSERCKNDIKMSNDDQSDDVEIRREKTALMKKVLTDVKPDPKTTFTALMDFDFFSQIRQPWRKCKDVDINYIV